MQEIVTNHKREDNRVGFLDTLTGTATTVDKETVQKELEKILLDNESIEVAYKVRRDFITFTNKRLIIIDKDGMTGSKKEYHSIPYKSVSHFAIEVNVDVELKLWISGSHEAVVTKLFKNDASIYEVQKILTAKCV